MLYLSEKFKECYKYTVTDDPTGTVPQLPTMYNRRCLVRLDNGAKFEWDAPNNTWVLVEGYPETVKPVLSGPTSAYENSTATITIDNYSDYSSNASFDITVSHGSFTRNGDSIEWSLPEVSADTPATMYVIAKEPNQYDSDQVVYNLTIVDVPIVEDQTLVYDSSSIPLDATVLYDTDIGSVNSIYHYAYKALGNILDETKTQAVDKIYIDNSKIDLEVGDYIAIQDKELLKVQSIGTDGADAYNDYVFFGNGKSFVVKSPDGALWGGGYNSGALGTGTTSYYTKMIRIPFSPYKVKKIFVTDSTFILTTDGELWCSGRNTNGELGLGDTTDRSTFTKLTLPVTFTDIKKIATVSNTTYIVTDSTVLSAGYNYYGQLGLGDTTDRSTFTDIGISAKDVSVGYYHVLLIDDTDTVLGCGANFSGQLGLGDTTDRSTFTSTGQSATGIRAYGYSSALIDTNGDLYVTGYNYNGELGLGDTTNRNVFTLALNSVSQIGGSYAGLLVLKSDGTLWGTGKNDSGELGLGDTADRSTFTQISVGTDVLKLLHCNSVSRYIDSAGNIWSTGSNSTGDIMDGTTTDRSTFTKAINEYDETFVMDLGKYNTGYYIVPETNASTVPTECYYWGHKAHFAEVHQGIGETNWTDAKNNYALVSKTDIQDHNNTSTVSQIYINNEIVDLSPGNAFASDSGEVFEVKTIGNDGVIEIIPNVRKIAGGVRCTMLIKDDGTVWGCGYNGYGQLGTGDTVSRSTFTQEITGITNAVDIDCGLHTLVKLEDGTLLGCGENIYGQLGLGDTTSRSTFTVIENSIKTFSCSTHSSTIIKNDGTVWGCGYNAKGQLGTGDTADRSTWTQEASGITNAVIISNGYHTSIIKNDGTVWSTGDNAYGQLGTGDTTSRSTFAQEVLGITDAIALDSSNYGDCMHVIRKDGTVWSVGQNDYGQLGLGDTTSRSTLTQIPGIENAVKVSSSLHSFILTKDGDCYACGLNNYGQLGLNDTTNRSTFTKIEINGFVIDVDASLPTGSGGTNSFAILTIDNKLFGTGINADGELGTGDTTDKGVFTGAIDAGQYPISYEYQKQFFYKNYYLTPVNDLQNAPNEVYPLVKPFFNEDEMGLPTSVTINSTDVRIDFADHEFPTDTNKINMIFKVSPGGSLTYFESTLWKYE